MENREPSSRKFRNNKTNEEIRFDYGDHTSAGHDLEDHYHRYNPKTPNGRMGDYARYLDYKGNPVSRGSDDSHLYPPEHTINEFNIKKYAGFFHDGDLREIQHTNGDFILSMESAQLLPEWNEDQLVLSKRDTLAGKLHILNCKNIKQTILGLENAKEISLKVFKIEDGYENGNIYRFKVESNKVILIIWWIKYLPEYEESSSFKYEIEAEKIFWENIPSLSDRYWDKLKKEYEIWALTQED